MNLTSIEQSLLFLSFIFLSIFLFSFFKKRYGEKYSHKWRKKSALNILNKLENFENDAQIFNYLRKIDPFVMEELILTAIDKRDDVKIVRNKKYTNDNGVDGRFYLTVENNGRKKQLKFIIQAKRYRSYINLNHLKEFKEQINRENAYSGLFVHTGKTSSTSFAFARNNEKIRIISGTKLVKLLKTGVF
jgi:restriction system protein